jgi:hypothetical protein
LQDAPLPPTTRRGQWRFCFSVQLCLALHVACDRIGAMEHPRTFSDFWPIYVLAHRQPLTRIFHSTGTLIGWAILAAAIALRRPWFILLALVVPYSLAWFSHFFVEHNRPATFGHPLWSWLADQKMVALVLAGKMSQEVNRCAALGGNSTGE